MREPAGVATVPADRPRCRSAIRAEDAREEAFPEGDCLPPSDATRRQGPNPARTYTDLRPDVCQIGRRAWYQQSRDKDIISALCLLNDKLAFHLGRHGGRCAELNLLELRCIAD